MRAGKLRTKVTFEQEIREPDGCGGYETAWGNPVTVFCEYVAQSGREQLEAGRIEAVTRATLKARWKAVRDITPAWRAVLDGDPAPWNIICVVRFGQHQRRGDIVIEKGSAV